MKVLDIITESAATCTPEELIIANWLKANPQLQVVEKIDPKVAKHAEGWIAKNQRVNTEVVQSLSTRYGPAFTFLKVIGVIAPLVLCIMNLRALNELAKEVDASGNYVNDFDWLKRQENAIVGVYLASVLTGIILKSITSGIFVTALRQMMGAVAMRTPGGGRATMVALFASQAAVTALQVWMNTPAGIEWCTHGLVMPLIIGGIGALGNIGLEFLRDKIKQHTGKDIGIVTPDLNKRKDAEKADNTAPTSDQIAKWQSDSLSATNPIAPANQIK